MLTQAEVEERMAHCLDELDSAVLALAPIADDAAIADVDFKVAFSKRRLEARAAEARVTNDHADDLATVGTYAERLSARVAENRLLNQREKLRALQARLSGLQTLYGGMRQVTR